MSDIRITLISDSTGETVSLAVQAAASQFESSKVKIETFSFIGRPSELETLPATIWETADLIVYTLVRADTSEALRTKCQQHGIQSISLLDPLVTALSNRLKAAPSSRPGQQYVVSSDYFIRLSALDYAMSHDDGQNPAYLETADVILTGVSRTSKTPTSIYLAYQGIKAANVPLVYRQSVPPSLLAALARGQLVVGLTASATRLAQIRSQRLQSLERKDIEYADKTRVEDEIVEARLFFDRYDLPVIDVTRRSIEETAASIKVLLRNRDP